MNLELDQLEGLSQDHVGIYSIREDKIQGQFSGVKVDVVSLLFGLKDPKDGVLIKHIPVD